MPPLKYLKVKEHLQTVVLEPDSSVKMPTVRELMRYFDVSLATVNRALSELENEGVIIRRQGSGIVAARRSGEVQQLRNEREKDRESVVMAYVDYPDEGIWNLTHTLEHYLQQKNRRPVSCKIYQETRMETVVRFTREQINCAGLILLVGASQLTYEDLKQLGCLTIPVVLLDSMFFYSELPKNVYIVSPDPESGGRLAAETLLRYGHRNIGYVRNEPASEFGDLKIKAIAAVLQQAGVEFGQNHIFSATIRSWENSLDAAQSTTEKNLEAIRAMKLTGIIYTSSNGAMAAIHTLTKAGFRIPDDISLTGEGDRQILRYVTPKLTVTSANYVDMCCQAVDIVIGEYKPEQRTIRFPQQLIERESIIQFQ